MCLGLLGVCMCVNEWGSSKGVVRYNLYKFVVVFRFFAQELGTMHLPEDYALQRLGQLTRSYMQELSAS